MERFRDEPTIAVGLFHPAPFAFDVVREKRTSNGSDSEALEGLDFRFCICLIFYVYFSLHVLQQRRRPSVLTRESDSSEISRRADEIIISDSLVSSF